MIATRRFAAILAADVAAVRKFPDTERPINH
jgi:hypothetical protein